MRVDINECICTRVDLTRRTCGDRKTKIQSSPCVDVCGWCGGIRSVELRVITYDEDSYSDENNKKDVAARVHATKAKNTPCTWTKATERPSGLLVVCGVWRHHPCHYGTVVMSLYIHMCVCYAGPIRIVPILGVTYVLCIMSCNVGWDEGSQMRSAMLAGISEIWVL